MEFLFVIIMVLVVTGVMVDYSTNMAKKEYHIRYLENELAKERSKKKGEVE